MKLMLYEWSWAFFEERQKFHLCTHEFTRLEAARASVRVRASAPSSVVDDEGWQFVNTEVIIPIVSATWKPYVVSRWENWWVLSEWMSTWRNSQRLSMIAKEALALLSHPIECVHSARTSTIRYIASIYCWNATEMHVPSRLFTSMSSKFLVLLHLLQCGTKWFRYSSREAFLNAFIFCTQGGPVLAAAIDANLRLAFRPTDKPEVRDAAWGTPTVTMPRYWSILQACILRS